MYLLNVIRGWSLQQHTTGYHHKKLSIQLTGEYFETAWMSHLSESMAMTPWSAVIHNIVSVCASEPGG